MTSTMTKGEPKIGVEDLPATKLGSPTQETSRWTVASEVPILGLHSHGLTRAAMACSFPSNVATNTRPDPLRPSPPSAGDQGPNET